MPTYIPVENKFGHTYLTDAETENTFRFVRQASTASLSEEPETLLEVRIVTDRLEENWIVDTGSQNVQMYSKDEYTFVNVVQMTYNSIKDDFNPTHVFDRIKQLRNEHQEKARNAQSRKTKMMHTGIASQLDAILVEIEEGDVYS